MSFPFGVGAPDVTRLLLLKERKLIGVMFATGLRAIAIAVQRLHLNRLGELHRQSEAIAMNGCGGTVLHWSGRDDAEDADGSRAAVTGQSDSVHRLPPMRGGRGASTLSVDLQPEELAPGLVERAVLLLHRLG